MSALAPFVLDQVGAEIGAKLDNNLTNIIFHMICVRDVCVRSIIKHITQAEPRLNKFGKSSALVNSCLPNVGECN